MDRATLRRGLVVLAITYFALWACGPIAVAPPPVPMAGGRTHELGLAPSMATRVPPCGISIECGGPSLAAWYRHTIGRSDVGAIAFGGSTTLGGVGVLFRHRLVQREAFLVALQLDGGFLYAAAGLPLAFALSEQTWVHLTPQVRGQAWVPLRLSTGLTFTSRGGVSLGAEAGAGWVDRGLGLDGTLHLGAQF